MFHIIDNIYLSNLRDAHNYNLIHNNHIRTVCRLSEDDNRNIYGPNILFKNYEIEDNFLYKDELLDIAEDIVSTVVLPMQEKNANVLIHCNEGQSRSVSVIIYYMIAYRNFTYVDALAHIKSIKPDANPNSAFADVLQTFERLLRWLSCIAHIFFY